MLCSVWGGEGVPERQRYFPRWVWGQRVAGKKIHSKPKVLGAEMQPAQPGEAAISAFVGTEAGGRLGSRWHLFKLFSLF